MGAYQLGGLVKPLCYRATYLGARPRIFWGTILVSFIYLIIAFAIPALIKNASKNAAVIAIPFIVVGVLILAAYGQYEIGLSGERHVSEYQRAKLKEFLSPIAASFPGALMVQSIDTPEALGYTAELMAALGFSGLKIVIADNHGFMIPPNTMRAIGTGVKGVFFQVKDIKNPPKEVQALQKALASANIKTGLYNNFGFPESDYILTVGLQ